MRNSYIFISIYIFLVLLFPIVLLMTRGIGSPEGFFIIGGGDIILAFLFWRKFKFQKYKKIIFIVVTNIVSILSPFIFIAILVNTPMQKKADDIMFKTCFPALRKYYGVKRQDQLPEKPVDKDGNPKWWIQERECEQNVWDGKGPVFSKNPKGFVPVSEHSK